MVDARRETPAEMSARHAIECWESHKDLLKKAKTCEPKMSRYWSKLARLTELNAERYEEHVKGNIELEGLFELLRAHPRDESILAEIRNKPDKKRVNAIMNEMVRVSKWKVT